MVKIFLTLNISISYMWNDIPTIKYYCSQVGNLAMESLLSLTSRRAGEWFKEELRLLGGLEHIVKTVSQCCQALSTRTDDIWQEADLAKLKKVDRCLRVLFNVSTFHFVISLCIIVLDT
jgi:hypothetical protein